MSWARSYRIRRKHKTRRMRKQEKIQRENLKRKIEAGFTSHEEWKEYRSCTRKVRYLTEDAVIRGCARDLRMYGSKSYWYKCSYCGGWHITTHSPKESNTKECACA